MTTHPNQASAFAAISALFVSILSIVLTFTSLWIQRRHNYKSLTPIASLPVGDYENLIQVKIKNTGVGPLIVKSFKVSSKKATNNNIITFMPETPNGIHWETFYNDLDGLCITPKEAATIIKLSGDPEDQNFSKYRDEVRKALSELSIEVEYKDIYNRKMPKKSRSLAWYGRHVSD